MVGVDFGLFAPLCPVRGVPFPYGTAPRTAYARPSVGDYVNGKICLGRTVYDKPDAFGIHCQC